MHASFKPVYGNLFKSGWIALLISASLMTLMHFGLAFVLDDSVLFIGYTVFNLYAFIVILVPFRRGEKWAWMATWLLPVGLALPAAQDPDIALYYFSVAAVCVLGLLLTGRVFFQNPETESPATGDS